MMIEISLEQYNDMAERLAELEYELAEAVQVVRCKDCRHAQDDITHLHCDYFGHKVYEDDYCSHGERRSNRGEEVNGFKSVGQAWNTSQERREK